MKDRMDVTYFVQCLEHGLSSVHVTYYFWREKNINDLVTPLTSKILEAIQGVTKPGDQMSVPNARYNKQNSTERTVD